mmetsp:Transcript_40960/g.63931  ORF Transcript_40960/g.63931 Transcript_40960/m.63931 type:complete len:84 (+) Transcript_40960:216-467(+)
MPSFTTNLQRMPCVQRPGITVIIDDTNAPEISLTSVFASDFSRGVLCRQPEAAVLDFEQQSQAARRVVFNRQVRRYMVRQRSI